MRFSRQFFFYSLVLSENKFLNEKKPHSPPPLQVKWSFPYLPVHLVHAPSFWWSPSCSFTFSFLCVFFQFIHVVRYFCLRFLCFVFVSWLSNLSILSVPDEGYPRNPSCALSLISTISLHVCRFSWILNSTSTTYVKMTAWFCEKTKLKKLNTRIIPFPPPSSLS